MPKAIPLEEHGGAVSASVLVAGFKKSRQTIMRTLAAAGCSPCGERNGYPVWNLGEAAAAILGVGGANEDDVPIDPRNLPSEKRNAWYASEQKRIAIEAEMRTLIPAPEVEAEMSLIAREVARFLETLPDVMERDMGLAPAQVQHMQKLIDEQRLKLRDRMAQPSEVLLAKTG